MAELAGYVIQATLAALILLLLTLSLRHARNADHELQNGTIGALGRIEVEQGRQADRLERMEGKVDRAHARINDVNDQVQRLWRQGS